MKNRLKIIKEEMSEILEKYSSAKLEISDVRNNFDKRIQKLNLKLKLSGTNYTIHNYNYIKKNRTRRI